MFVVDAGEIFREGGPEEVGVPLLALCLVSPMLLKLFSRAQSSPEMEKKLLFLHYRGIIINLPSIASRSFSSVSSRLMSEYLYESSLGDSTLGVDILLTAVEQLLPLAIDEVKLSRLLLLPFSVEVGAMLLPPLPLLPFLQVEG